MTKRDKRQGVRWQRPDTEWPEIKWRKITDEEYRQHLLEPNPLIQEAIDAARPCCDVEEWLEATGQDEALDSPPTHP